MGSVDDDPHGPLTSCRTARYRRPTGARQADDLQVAPDRSASADLDPCRAVALQVAPDDHAEVVERAALLDQDVPGDVGPG